MTHHASTHEKADTNTDTDTDAPMPLHRRIHRVGVVVLGLGLISAVVLYVVALNNGDSGTGGTSEPDFSGDRRFNYQLERIGGKSAIYMAAINRWLGSLWHGTNLAWTVGTLSLLMALACFWLANFLSYPPLPEPEERADPADGCAPGTSESP